MPYSSRLTDNALIQRPVFGQSDTGRRYISGWTLIAAAQRCHLQVNDFEAILSEFGMEGKAQAICYFRKDVDLVPKVGGSSDLPRDRLTISQRDGNNSVWQVEGVLYRKDKRGGYAVAALSHAAIPD